MIETVCPGGGIKDALRVGTGADPPRRPILVHGQIIPQKIRETLDSSLWRRESKHIGSTEKRLRRNLDRNDEHERRTGSERSQQVADARILGHVIVMRPPTEN